MLHPHCYQCAVQVPFVPKRWRPKDAGIPQIAHTFPPRILPSRKASKAADDEPAKRKRKLTPSAWTQGDAFGWGGGGVCVCVCVCDNCHPTIALL